ncbi:MAG: hypothetical protein WCK28_13995 [Burkholderiales bacterium]
MGLLLVLTAWFVQDRTGRVERDLARRLQDAELRDGQRDQQLKLLGDTLRETQAKAAVLEAKLADSLGQQSQLRQLYDEMARTRGDLMLADVENSIMIAAQQLQIGSTGLLDREGRSLRRKTLEAGVERLGKNLCDCRHAADYPAACSRSAQEVAGLEIGLSLARALPTGRRRPSQNRSAAPRPWRHRGCRDRSEGPPSDARTPPDARHQPARRPCSRTERCATRSRRT